MNSQKTMEECRRYIEAHLNEPLTAEYLSEKFGYSFYHFAHMFRAYFGVPPGVYIRILRLEKAAQAIEQGESIARAGKDAGFETQAGFAKAFQRHFGLSATRYRKLKQGGNQSMQPQIMESRKIRLIGYEYAPTGVDALNYCKDGAYWSNIDFSQYADYHNQFAHRGEIGVWVNPNETSGELSYFYGIVSNRNEPMPRGFKELILPDAKYATFSIESPEPFSTTQLAASVRKMWQFIFTEWLEERKIIFEENKLCFEYYRGKIIQVFIPIK
ncbi:MAG: helix-turn-helix domain-containing protein [Eubacterium callanderi]|uniref:helix-turn-helix domain-containing protein n=1 Tax=Eubacterium callanderi TaxID=53442 RepID=UPI0039940924